MNEKMQGTLEGIEDAMTGSGKPKKIVKLGQDGKQYPTKINYCGRDLDAVSPDLSSHIGELVEVEFTFFEIPGGEYQGTKMRMGKRVTLNPTPCEYPTQSATPPTKVAQGATPAPKPAFVAIRKDTKGIKMGMIGCAKAVHNPTDSVDQQFYKAQKLFKAIEFFVLKYDGRPDLEIIQKKMIDAGTSDDFWEWLAKQYKVDDKYSLQVKDTIYTIDHFVQAGAKFITDTAVAIKAKEQSTSAIPHQDEDIHREQSFDELAPAEEMPPDHFDGPEDTPFPPNINIGTPPF